MVEYIGYGVGGACLISTIFMAGHTVATRSKLDGMVKKDDCMGYRESINVKLEKIHEKIHNVSEDVAEIKGILKKDERR